LRSDGDVRRETSFVGTLFLIIAGLTVLGS